MYKPKKILLIYLLTMISVIITACGGEAPSSGIVESYKETETADPNKGKTVIVYARGMDETEATATMIEEYNNQSESVYVVYQELPYDSDRKYDQVVSAFSQGAPAYDVMDINITWTAEFADKGYIQDIGEFIEKENYDISAYMKPAIDASMYKGKIWGLPRNIATGVLFYRDDLVSEPPKTWNELIADTPELVIKNNMKYGYVMAGKESSGLVLEAAGFIYAYGGRIVDDGGRIVINSREAINGLNKMHEVFNSDFVPYDIKERSDTDSLVSFMNGESLYMYNPISSWAIIKQKGSLVSSDFSVAPLPNGDKGGTTTLSGSIMLMSKNSANKEAVWDFMKFAAGYEGQKINALYGSRIPTISSVLRDEEVIDANPGFASQSLIAAIEKANPIPITPYYKELTDVMQKEVYSFLNSEQDAKRTVERIESILNDEIGADKGDAK